MSRLLLFLFFSHFDLSLASLSSLLPFIENSIYEVSADGNSISITDPREGDSTVFQCVLENEHGQRVGSYTITILGEILKINIFAKEVTL